jgi:hypothetical protein
LKALRIRQYSFKELTQFKVPNKELDYLASNINDSGTQATLPFTCMGRFCSKVMFLSHETLRAGHYSLKEQTQFTVLNKVLDSLVSNLNDFLRRPTVLLLSIERGFLHKVNVPHP